MYKALLAKWNAIPSFAANQHFPKFRYYLERGGMVAIDYIEGNADFVETILGGKEVVQALKSEAARKNTAHENQLYFVREAKRLENPIKTVLRTKYNVLRGYCEQNSLPWGDLTPETLLPATRRAVENGNWDTDIHPVSESSGEDTKTETRGESVDDGQNETSIELTDGKVSALSRMLTGHELHSQRKTGRR